MADLKAYVDVNGNYLGHFDISNAPIGSVPVSENPTIGFGSTWNGSSWVNPPATPFDILSEKLNTGLNIVSSGNPLLNATYALDQISQDQLFQIGSFVKVFGFFPSGNANQDYPDITGQPHTFNTTQFVNLLLSVASYVSAAQSTAVILTNGGQANWPNPNKTIA